MDSTLKRARLELERPIPKPLEKGIQQLYDFMNCREAIRRRREKGVQGAALYQGLPLEFATYFRRFCCPNVHRYHDRTTIGLHRFCAAERRWKLCQTDEERMRLKRLLVLNFAVWRFIGGTVLFASEVGFLNGWGEDQKRRIREVVERGFRERRSQELFTDAYKGPGAIRQELTHPKADEDSLLRVLYNEGPKAVQNFQPDITFYTLVGKFQLIDKVWQDCYKILTAALPKAGQTELQAVCEILAELPFFGASEDGIRVPGFFAKELVQDLMDTPVFKGGRQCVKDRHSYCPAGPGALEGLRLICGCRVHKREAVHVMRELLSSKHLWKFGTDLDLHDIQFMLCELQKFLHQGQSLRDYAGPQCVIGLPLDPEFIRHRLEDAVLLGLVASADETAIAAQLSEWMGFRLPLPKDDRIRSGDHVILRKVKEPVCLLELQENGELGPAKDNPTPFRVELPRLSQPLRSCDMAFLRAPNGAHLGPVSQFSAVQRGAGHPELFSAHPGSDRFAYARQLTVRKVGGGGTSEGDPLRLGDSVLLYSGIQTKDDGNGKKALQVRMEPEIIITEMETELKDIVHDVISWDFDTDEMGKLRVKDPLRVRSRCIGSSSRMSPELRAWRSSKSKLTGHWATDCGSL